MKGEQARREYLVHHVEQLGCESPPPPTPRWLNLVLFSTLDFSVRATTANPRHACWAETCGQVRQSRVAGG